MQLETRIRIKALAFGALLVFAEVAIAAAMSWWQTQSGAGNTGFAQVAGSLVEFGWPYVLRIRCELPGLLAELF